MRKKKRRWTLDDGLLDILQANADMDATEDQFSFSRWEFDEDDDEDILPG